MKPWMWVALAFIGTTEIYGWVAHWRLRRERRRFSQVMAKLHYFDGSCAGEP